MNANQKDALRMLITLRHAARVQIREHGRTQALIAKSKSAKGHAIAAGLIESMGATI